MIGITRFRALAALFAFALATLGLGSSSTPATADPVIPLNWTIKASTTLKSLGQTIDVPPGMFSGTIDLGTGELRGDLSLPAATTTMKIGSLPLANATFAMTQAQPIVGKVDLAKGEVTVTASFNFSLKSLKPTLLPINLVGNRCRGVTPVTVTMTGQVNLAGDNTFSAEYTIPKFRDCGFLVTPILNLIAPGPGNTFTATFSPTPAV